MCWRSGVQVVPIAFAVTDNPANMIAIADQVSRRVVPWERFSELLSGPRRRRMGGDRDAHDASTFVRQDHQTNSRRHVAVGTTKKSAAISCPTWFVKNVRQVCDGGRRWRTMYFATLA